MHSPSLEEQAEQFAGADGDGGRARVPLHHLHQVDVEAAGEQQGAHFTCRQSGATQREKFKLQIEREIFPNSFFKRLPAVALIQPQLLSVCTGRKEGQMHFIRGTGQLTVAGDERGNGAGRRFKHAGRGGVDQHGRHQLAVDGGPAQETHFSTSFLHPATRAPIPDSSLHFHCLCAFVCL